MGKKIGFPAGMVISRTEVPPKAPARNQTSSTWPWPAFTPVVSRLGLTAFGIENIHCHHLALHSPYDDPYDWTSTTSAALAVKVSGPALCPTTTSSIVKNATI